MRKAIGLALILAAGAATAATVFEDDFSVLENSGNYVTGGLIGASSWNVTRSGADWGARIDGNVLELSNDAGGTGTANADGWAFAGQTLSDSGGFDTTLGNSAGVVTWSFNLRQIRSSPAGFGANSYGVAFVLGSSTDNVRSNGNGYAVVLGNTGTPDPIRLVSFTGGFSSLGTGTGGLITSGPPLDNPTNRYMSVKVTYNPADNLWSLYGRDDGASSFTDPLSGSLSFIGSATDSTYTGSDLPYLGGYWQGSTAATQNAKFDNVTLSVIPEPASFGLLALGAVAARLLRRRR